MSQKEYFFGKYDKGDCSLFFSIGASGPREVSYTRQENLNFGQ